MKHLFTILLTSIAGMYFFPPLSGSEKSDIEFCTIKKLDATTSSSRARHLSREFAQILGKKFPLDFGKKNDFPESQDPQVLTAELLELLSQFIVNNSDIILGHLSGAKFNRTTYQDIYQEVTCLGLEQIFPMAINLGCFNEFMQQLREGNGSSLFNFIQEKLKNTSHISQLNDHGEEIRVEFSGNHAQFIVSKIQSIGLNYQLWLNHEAENCAIHLLPEITLSMANHRKNSRSLLPSAVLDFYLETFAKMLVVETNKIAEDLKKKSLFEIYEEIIQIILPHILPTISSAGRLWNFANLMARNDPKSTFNEKLKTLFKQKAPNIMNQNGNLKEKKYIKKQIQFIQTILYEKIKTYFEIFQKQKTFGDVHSPL